MKTIIYVIICLSLSLSAISQPCEYLSDGRDEFTGATKRSTWSKLSKSFVSGCNIIFEQVGDQYYIRLNYTQNGTVKMVNGMKDPLMLKFMNDSVIECRPVAIQTADFGQSGSAPYTQFKPAYLVSREHLQFIAANNLVKYRIYLSDSYIEEEVKGKFMAKISLAAGCLLK